MRENRYGLIIASLILAAVCIGGIFLLTEIGGDILSLPQSEDVVEEHGGVGALALLMSYFALFVGVILLVIAVLTVSSLGLLTALLSLRRLYSKAWRIIAVAVALFHGTVVVIIFIPIFIAVVGTVFALF